MVGELVLPSYAKVNLTLDVLDKRPEDGYHYIKTVMLPISLADTVTLRDADDIQVVSSPEILGPPEMNLAFRAANLLKKTIGYRRGASIHISKVIPVAGGLAGGSTNAAAVLTGLNRLWRIGLKEQELIELALKLGSDVPFFVTGRAARVEGIGEKITTIPVSRPLWVVLAFPAVGKSTANVYRLFDEMDNVSHPSCGVMEQALATGNLEAIAGSLANVFEQVMLPRHPEILAVKKAMLDGGALGALMSGAGPTVLGLVKDEDAGCRLVRTVTPLAGRSFLVRTVCAQGE